MAKGSNKNKRKSKGPKPLANGDTASDLMFEAMLIKPEGEEKYTVQVTDNRPNGASDGVAAQTKEVKCLACHQPID